jgi:hypothetical protein
LFPEYGSVFLRNVSKIYQSKQRYTPQDIIICNVLVAAETFTEPLTSNVWEGGTQSNRSLEECRLKICQFI